MSAPTYGTNDGWVDVTNLPEPLCKLEIDWEDCRSLSDVTDKLGLAVKAINKELGKHNLALLFANGKERTSKIELVPYSTP